MNFLPIVERELRVAARRRFTYWSRLASAGFLLVIFGMILFFLHLASQAGFSIGQIAFTALRWIAFVFAASAGVFLTSDSLSEEKREGTMGLLFLTDLRGHDIVFGKLMSQSLQSFYGLLACFPMLALPLLAGGVTGDEFGRTILVLCNTLFCSLAIGLFVSSVSREVIKAMSGALLFSLLVLLGLPWGDLALADWDQAKWEPILSHASPGWLFASSANLWPKDFWLSLGLQHFIAWMLLGTACLIVPRAWQEKATAQNSYRTRFFNAWRFGTRAGRLSFRRKWLAQRPVYWLAMRDRWLPRLVMLVTVVAAVALGLEMYVNWGLSGPRDVNGWREILVLLLYLWVATQSCRFYLEAVRTGAMELILVTPASPVEIVRSQWTALRRVFLVPLLLLLAVQIVSEGEILLSMRKSMPAATASSGFNMVHYQIADLCISAVNFISRTMAMGWFGMWLGLTNRKVSIAVLKIILFVCILPWIVELFLQGVCMVSFSFAKMPFWSGLIPPAVLELAKNIVFIVVSRRKLLIRFRETVAQAGHASAVRWKRGSLAATAAVDPRPVIT